ncbi:translation initiation factor III [Actinoplanes regularis]|uniref:translation initiation factor III n=1 Tax=Actinoplanes regularis TaxID=52697 RepID=UPI002557820B|nr:translation initiation factor III [Actinoplanes regularis]GLW31530.1 hypothetical protein Areg01_44700 [Actinoplanes regularis]
MARSKKNERTASRVAVDIGSTGKGNVPTGAVILLVVCVLAALWAVAMMTVPGRVGYVYFFTYAEFYMGVLTLVSLSITIMVGLVSTDRLVLSIRQRVFLQSTHRTTGVMAISALVFHLWTKTVESHIRVIDIFVPFITPTNTVFIGLGQISGIVMIVVTWSGLVRAKFIGRGKPWMWRAIHSISYLIWPLALVHGLSAGRAAATWVIVSYVVCVLAVLIGLAVRLSVSLNRRKDFASAAGVGASKPSSNNVVPTASAPRNRWGGGGRGEQQNADLMAPAAPAVSNWVPAAQPAAPAAPEPAPAPVASQRELEAPAPRQRRSAEDDRFDEPTRAMPRRDYDDDRYEEPAARGRRRDDDFDDGPRSRGRRYADEDEEPRGRRSRSSMEETGTRLRADETGTRLRADETGTRLRAGETGTRMRLDDTQTRMRRYAEDDDYDGRGRRRADDDRYEDVPRQRAPRYEEDDEPRGRRRADDGRQSRSQFVDLSDDQPRGGGAPAGRSRGRDDDDSYFSQLRGDSN